MMSSALRWLCLRFLLFPLLDVLLNLAAEGVHQFRQVFWIYLCSGLQRRYFQELAMELPSPPGSMWDQFVGRARGWIKSERSFSKLNDVFNFPQVLLHAVKSLSKNVHAYYSLHKKRKQKSVNPIHKRLHLIFSNHAIHAIGSRVIS